MAGFFGFAVNGGAINPPALLLNPGVAPVGGFPDQRVNGPVTFANAVLMTLADINQVRAETVTYLTTVGDNALQNGSIIRFETASKRTVKLSRNVPAPPPAPPDPTFGTQFDLSPNTYSATFTVRFIPGPPSVQYINASASSVTAYQYDGLPAVVTKIPYFTTAAYYDPVPGDPNAASVTVSACYYPPTLVGNVLPPTPPDFVYLSYSLDTFYH